MSADPLSTSHKLRVYDDILDTIGTTPMVRLARLAPDLPCLLYAKVEFFNPGGSVKDRIARNIIEEAEADGRLRPGGTVVEATSGNTGLGLAIVCALKGYKSVFVMPDKMSQEKIQLLRAFGGRVVITPTAVSPEDPRSYYQVANRIVEETPNAILANQYHNPENPRSHYLTTGPEIWEQTEGRVTDVVIGMGTGGTITGVGRYLKERDPEVRIIGVDPVGSILYDLWQYEKDPGEIPAHPYKVEGIGEDFLPTTLDLSIVDEVIQVTDRESFLWTRRLVKQEGIFCGGSSGSAVAGAIRYARGLSPDRVVVVVLPDSGSRYLSKVFDDKWMRENGFLEGVWTEATLDQVVSMKPSTAGLITVDTDDRMVDVIALMREHDISQVPALRSDGTLAGLVTEVDLLKHMLAADHEHSPDETIESILQPVRSVFPPGTPLEEVLPALTEGQAVLIADEDRPVGILSKIDILDYLAREI